MFGVDGLTAGGGGVAADAAAAEAERERRRERERGRRGRKDNMTVEQRGGAVSLKTRVWR
jgi:hypothetical protein